MSNKTFWQRPEGITGILFLLALVGGGGVLLYRFMPMLLALASNTLYLAIILAVLVGLVYLVLDAGMRNLVWYMYKSLMRSITGLFIQINPIAILKSYIKDLEQNLRNLSKQIGKLRGQMRQLKGTMDGNASEIEKNLRLAAQARQGGDDKTLTISSRKAARLQEANGKYQVLFERMEALYRVLSRMYENAEIMLEDTRDSVHIREQEYAAIKASYGAIQSAKSILEGHPDKRAMFDQALEDMADDVSKKVGEMERFMQTSKNLMDSIDLRQGVFEEEGLRMLESWERDTPLLKAPDQPLEKIGLDAPPKVSNKPSGARYDDLFR